MHIAVYLPLLVPVAAALLAGRVAPRLHPGVAAWLLTLAAVLLAAASTVALGLLVMAGLVRVPAVAALGELSPAVLYRDDSPPPVLSAAAAVALGAGTLAAVHMVVRRVRALLRAAREADLLPGGQVAVLDDPAVADAFALPGRPGRIVISTGMLAALNPDERRALLAHERAHLHHGHHWLAAATHLAVAANPLLRPLGHHLAYALERWADEEAARVTGDRRLVARAIARAALARKASSSPARTELALGVAGPAPVTARELAGAGPMPRRVAALLAPPPPGRRLLVLAVVVVLLLTGGALVDATYDLHALIESAQT